MTSIYQKVAIATTGLSLSLAMMGAKPARAETWTFKQRGFLFNGMLSGTFTGEDLNEDGIIQFDSRQDPDPFQEVTNFSVTFQNDISTFSHDLQELILLTFELDSFELDFFSLEPINDTSTRSFIQTFISDNISTAEVGYPSDDGLMQEFGGDEGEIHQVPESSLVKALSILTVGYLLKKLISSVAKHSSASSGKSAIAN